MAQSPAVNGLASAALLRQSPSRANMANYEDIFAGPSAGHVPSAWEQLTAEQNQTDAASSLGATPAFMGLRHADEGARLRQIEGSLAQEADLEGGRPQHLARMTADANNELADVNSEAAFGRGELPFATQARDRNRADALGIADARYGAPARAKAAGDITSAEITARGRVQAAEAPAHSLPVKGLQNALLEFINKTGSVPSADDVAKLKALFPDGAPAAPTGAHIIR